MVQTLKTVKRTDAISACQQDINYLRILCSPKYPHDFPDIYVAIFILVTKNLDKPEFWLRFVIALPRGHLKTTFLELLNVWIITFTDLQSFLIVAETLPKAERILSSVMDLMSSENYVALFGNWEDNATLDNAKEKEFYLLDKHIRISITSALGKVRGDKRIERYQMYLIDDAFSREDADSPAKFKKFKNWMTGTLLKGRNAKRAIVIYAGNKYPTKQCFVSLLASQKSWISVMVGAIQPDGTALMPHIRSLESLLQELADDIALDSEDAFLAEMMNGEASGVSSGIDLTKMPEAVTHMDMVPWGRVLILDPATNKETLDQVAIGVADLYDNGFAVFTHVEENKLAHDELAIHIVSLAMQYNIPLLCYEDVQFQHIFKREIERNLEALGIYHVSVMPVSPKGTPKKTRILNDFLKMIVPRINVSTNQQIPAKVLFYPEAREVMLNRLQVFNISIADNVDDVMDMGAYLQQVLRTPQLKDRAVIPLNMQIEPEAPVISGQRLI